MHQLSMACLVHNATLLHTSRLCLPLPAWLPLRACRAALPAAACAASKDCVVIPASADSSSSSSDDGLLPGMCLSRHVQGLDRAAMKKFTFEVALAEPSAVGSCDGACWMRQVRGYIETKNEYNVLAKACLPKSLGCWRLSYDG